MIFTTDHAIENIINGVKTQTRRIVKPGEGWATVGIGEDEHEVNTAVMNGDSARLFHTPYVVGKTYAVQPGRGKPGMFVRQAMNGQMEVNPIKPDGEDNGWYPLRIRIKNIRREDVRNISEDDALAEGFLSREDFIIAWAGLHDKATDFDVESDSSRYIHYYQPKHGWRLLEPEEFWPLLMERPAHRYDAWVLEFEVVRGSRLEGWSLPQRSAAHV
jgi:hypothetical protein